MITSQDRTTEPLALQRTIGAPRKRGRRPFYTAPFRWLNRVWAFFEKEVTEVRRQPLLILSLIAGPLVVLLAFGASYRNSNPVLRTAVVMPADGSAGISTDQLKKLAGLNFEIDEVTTDRAAAEEKLRRGELDVIQIVPANVTEMIKSGQSAQIEFHSNAINPLTESWIQYIAYAEVTELNKALLREQAVQAQGSATRIKERITVARQRLDAFEASTGGDVEKSRQDLRDLVTSIDQLEAVLPPAGVLAGGQVDIAEMRASLSRVRRSAQTLDQALASGDSTAQLSDVRQMRQDLDSLDTSIDVFVKTPADLLVAPLHESYSNIRGKAYDAAVYYAPAVLALLVQHTAITLGALALVRERLYGAFELFRVAPLNAIQMLAGKYLGYTLFISVTATVLLFAMLGLGVPMLGNPYVFAGLLVLLTLASLGVGFLISSVVQTDSQAIQLAMITLLFSIFFSGFFIALDSFTFVAQLLANIIPMTHGLNGLHDVMLRGAVPGPTVWESLGVIAGVTFVAVALLTQRRLRRA